MWKPNQELIDAFKSMKLRKVQSENIVEFRRLTGKGKSCYYMMYNIVQEKNRPTKNISRWKEFHNDLPKGKRFIRMWNKAYQDGIQQKLAKEFNISVATVYRIRKLLGLKDLHDPTHPGQRKFLKRIKRMYVWENKSTLYIAKVLRMSTQSIQNKLRQIGVEMKPQHCTNPAYFKTKSGITPVQLLDKIKKMYVDKKLSAAEIARELKIDQGTVSTKLRAMNIPIVSRRKFEDKIIVYPSQNIKGIYLGTSNPFGVICQSAHTYIIRKVKPQNIGVCQWCKKEFPKYISHGSRAQKACSHRCKNLMKDYRRMMRGQRISIKRITMMEDYLKEVWGKKFNKAIEKILDVKPMMTNKRTIKEDVLGGEEVIDGDRKRTRDDIRTNPMEIQQI